MTRGFDQRPVLRHVPAGIGHPYAVSPDQRVPVQPILGSTLTLNVVALPEVTDVRCWWRAPGAAEPIALRMVQDHSADADRTALLGGEGHLAAAQAALPQDAAWTVTMPGLTEPGPYKYRFETVTSHGPAYRTPWFTVEAATWSETTRPGHRATLRATSERVRPEKVSWLSTSSGVHRGRVTLPLRPGDKVVGFGERFDRLDHVGHRLDAVVFEQYKGQGRYGRTYLPMPFAHVLGADGTSWGFHVRTSRRTWFDVGASDPSSLVIEVALGATPDELIDLAVYEGSPTEVLSAFLDEVGRAEELPDWVFRLWASGNEWNTQATVMERLNTHRDLDIPVGVVVIEAWSDEEGIMIARDAHYSVHEDGAPFAGSEFSYPADGPWPDPAGMVNELHARGIRVLLWQIPLLKTTDTEPGLRDQVLYEASALVRSGHLVKEADGRPYRNRGWWFPHALMPDLSTPAGREHWTDKRAYLVRDWDIDGFKTDGGEHAWGDDLCYGDGRRGDEGNNLYPVHYARAFGDLLRRHGKPPVTFSRSGFTGSQAHGVFWAGDEDSTWEAFRSSILAGLSAAACGLLYWGWDLAGFSGPIPDPELYLRAAAAATFMPIMQYHSEFNHHRSPCRDRTPWNVAEQFSNPNVVATFRGFAQLRERLVPYLATSARTTITTAQPMMRPLFFDHPDDANVWNAPLQWMLGSHLLVNPVTQPGVNSWTTYLPEGTWVDTWTGQDMKGGRFVECDAPMDTIPVYCAGAGWAAMGPAFNALDGQKPGRRAAATGNLPAPESENVDGRR